jgi:hypothetical protein
LVLVGVQRSSSYTNLTRALTVFRRKNLQKAQTRFAKIKETRHGLSDASSSSSSSPLHQTTTTPTTAVRAAASSAKIIGDTEANTTVEERPALPLEDGAAA